MLSGFTSGQKAIAALIVVAAIVFYPAILVGQNSPLQIDQQSVGSSYAPGDTVHFEWSGGDPNWSFFVRFFDFDAQQAISTGTLYNVPNTGSVDLIIPCGFGPGNYGVYIQENGQSSWGYSHPFALSGNCGPLQFDDSSFNPTYDPGDTIATQWTGGDPVWNIELNLVDVSINTALNVGFMGSLSNDGQEGFVLPPTLSPGMYQLYIKDSNHTEYDYSLQFEILAPPPDACAITAVGHDDMIVWRPSNGTWFVRTSTSNWNSVFNKPWGVQGDIPIHHGSDFDGDGLSDMAVWRPSDGSWRIRQSSTNWTGPGIIRTLGQQGDIPLQNADFDGDCRADMAVWRPSNGTWYILTSSSNWNTSMSRQWGTQGDVPIHQADFDGDGRDDMAVWRPSSHTWFVRTSSTNWNGVINKPLGATGDEPVQHTDFDGDGQDDMILWRPSDGSWHVRTSSSSWSTIETRNYGMQGDTPLAASDFNGDGSDDVAVWRPSDGRWSRQEFSPASSNGYGPPLGAAGDVPLSGLDMDGDGRTDMVIWRPSDGTWHVQTSQSTTFTRQWGANGDIPIIGNMSAP